MPGKAGRWARTGIIWFVTAAVALGIGFAGFGKFGRPEMWGPLFAGWGYPHWFMCLVGAVELGGAIALLIPPIAAYAALLLAAVMLGAFITLVTHPGGPLGWGATPLVYLVVLLGLAAARWQRRLRP
jgi:uncharacterized membrane protein YphA (DoxX/SURF4 family)